MGSIKPEGWIEGFGMATCNLNPSTCGHSQKRMSDGEEIYICNYDPTAANQIKKREVEVKKFTNFCEKES